jgi:hypothetical protein
MPAAVVTPAAWIRLSDRLAGLAVLLAAVSAAAGLFVPDIYRDADAWIRQARAADLVTLLAVVPALAVGLCRARAGSDAARMVALAGLGYLAYNYAIFGFSVAINPMTPLHIAILGLSVWSLVLAIVAFGRSPFEPAVGSRLPRRTTATFLLAVPALFGLMWSAQIAQAISSGLSPEALAKLGLPTNPVYTLDLAFALPFLASSGILLLRGARAGAAIAVAALCWVVLMGFGVLAIFAFDAAAGATVPLPVVAVIGVITGVAGALATAGIRLPRHGAEASPAAAQGSTEYREEGERCTPRPTTRDRRLGRRSSPISSWRLASLGSRSSRS